MRKRGKKKRKGSPKAQNINKKKFGSTIEIRQLKSFCIVITHF